MEVVGGDAGKHIGALAADLDRACADLDAASRPGAVALTDHERTVADGQCAANVQAHDRAFAQAAVTASQQHRDDARHWIGLGAQVAAHSDVDGAAAVAIAEGLRQQAAR